MRQREGGDQIENQNIYSGGTRNNRTMKERKQKNTVIRFAQIHGRVLSTVCAQNTEKPRGLHGKCVGMISMQKRPL